MPPIFSAIRMITFDADDTLWDFAAMQLRGSDAAAAAIRERGGPAAAHITGEYLVAAYRAYTAQGVDPAAQKWITLRRAVFQQVMEEAGLPEAAAIAAEMAAIYTRARNTDIPLYPGAREVLAALHGRFKLGWVTNGNDLPDLVGLGAYFDVAVTADRLGAAKPDPAVFAHVAAAAGVPPEAILHVGDSLHSDVAGAKGAGCKTAWFNPRGLENETEHVPDAEIRHLLDVVALLEGMT